MNHSQSTTGYFAWLKFHHVDPHPKKHGKTSFSESPFFHGTKKDGPCWSQSRAHCSSAALDSNCAKLGAGPGDDGGDTYVATRMVKSMNFAI